MNLSMRWLKDYVDVDVAPRQFAADMTMSGSKVEGYEIEGAELENIVVGQVLSVDKHPNADSLVICKVNVGSEQPLQIVTGATNVVPNCIVPVALNNSVVAGGKKIKTGKLRGELSEGMLCSLEELNLTKGDFPYAIEDGIFLLEEENLTLGQDIREALGLNDTIVEFEITPNRPDCLSVIGLAREAAVTYGKPLQLPEPAVKGAGDSIDNYLSVTVENTEKCLRYAAAAVKNVKIGPSPRWLRERLRASGVRPISNIVDITNYVMLEYGQPMHAFDLVHVKGQKIVVRDAGPGEKITTLDGVERTLSPDMLVIADAEAPSAVAGVMGGEWSGVYETTNTVIFESACFHGGSVRRTSRKLGLRTESSGRFEKGLDPHNCLPALRRACELVELLGAGEVVDGVVDVASPVEPLPRIPLDPDWVNRFLGVEMPGEQMESILRSLEFTVENGYVTPPTFRADVESKADLAEEIARFYGYDKIPTTPLRGSSEARLTPMQRFERNVHETLIAQGLNEVMTYSFTSPRDWDRIELPADSPLREAVVIRNPLGEDTSIMRTTAIPSMLEVLARNHRARNRSAYLYELATEYIPTTPTELPVERKQVLIGLYGPDADFYRLKGAVEALLERVGVTVWEVQAKTDHPTFHPGRCAALSIGGEEVGVLGQIHPTVAAAYEVDTTLYVAQIPLLALLDNATGDKSYRPLPRFPASTRDLALVCDEAVPVAALSKAMRTSMGATLESLELFDIYRGEQLGAGKKSVAWSLTLRAQDRTLTDEECDRLVNKALKALEAVGATLRS